MKKRSTIKDVAARAGVAYQTVSKVINGQAQVLPETEARIWEAARALGYRASHSARSLRGQRSRMIGYSWVPARPGEENAVLDLFLTSMVHEAEAAGYHLLPFPFHEGENPVDAYRDLIDAGRVDGFVLSSMNYNDPRVPFLQEREMPFVAFGRTGAQPDFSYVDVDGAAGLREATTHLIRKGHRRVAVLAWPDGSQVGDDRLAGYLSAMAEAGLAVDPGWVARGEGSFEFGLATTQRWLDATGEAGPTAVVALSDRTAVGALQAVQARGLRPGHDLAVIGFDDTPLVQYLSPPLTTLRQPLREVGRRCVEILVSLLEDKPVEDTQVLLAPELIVRGTA